MQVATSDSSPLSTALRRVNVNIAPKYTSRLFHESEKREDRTV